MAVQPRLALQLSCRDPPPAPLPSPSPPAQNPVPSSLPQDTSASPPPHPADIDVCPQDLHAQKLKLPMSGHDYALSVQIAEWKGREHPPGGVSRGKSGAGGAHGCPHRRLPWGWRQTPLRSRQSAAGGVAFPLSLPSVQEGRKGGREPLTLPSSPGFISSFFPSSNSKWKPATYPGVTSPTLGSA